MFCPPIESIPADTSLSVLAALLSVKLARFEHIRVRFRGFVSAFQWQRSRCESCKVIQLLTNFEAKIKVEGVEAHTVHEEFASWCKTQWSDLTFAVQTGQKEKADLEANLVKLGASSESHQAKIADLAGSAATTEADLKAAIAIRAKEHADFEQSEKELLDVTDTLGRAIVIIEKEMKGGADDATPEGWKRHRCSQCNGTGIVDQFCRRHETHGAGAEFSEFR